MHCVKKLLDSGADANITDNNGKKASHFVDNSQGHGSERLLKQAENGILEKRMKDPATGKWTTLFYAKDSMEFVKPVALKQAEELAPRVNKDQWLAYFNNPKRTLHPIKADSTTFSVVSYNILADAYTKAHYFPWSPSHGKLPKMELLLYHLVIQH